MGRHGAEIAEAFYEGVPEVGEADLADDGKLLNFGAARKHMKAAHANSSLAPFVELEKITR